MYKIIYPFINLATGSLAGFSRFILASPRTDERLASQLWQSTLENQACFINEYTAAVLDSLAQSRQAMNAICEKLHCRSELVANQLAHSTVRAVAIATQARREKRDRRVFPLPRVHERRAGYPRDRRLPLPADAYRAVA